MTTLFDPTRFANIAATNRIVMAPLTRNRVDSHRTPTPLMISHHEQRATTGLIVSEATQISPAGKDYLDTPGICSAAQIEAWGSITEAIHVKGGKIVAQLWHVVRISHVFLQPNGQMPVSSTAHRDKDIHHQGL
jgi:N-ethylmaleimide reductase